MVEDLKRALSPREEKRALQVLSGKRRAGKEGLVLVAGALAVALSAGSAFVLGHRARGEGELRLVGGLLPPPEEPVSALPGPAAKSRDRAGSTAEAPPAGVPVFLVGAAPPRAEWVELGGPLVDTDLRPPQTGTGP